MKTLALFLFILLAGVPVLQAEPSPSPAAPTAAKASPAPPAFDPDISVKASINKAAITIGDPVEYTITITRSSNVQLLSNIPSPDSDILKIKSIKDISEKEGPKTVEGKKFTLTTFRLGQFVLNPVLIQYKKGEETKMLTTEPIYLTVESVAKGETKVDIRGLKAVLNLPAGILLALLLILVMGLIAAGVFVFRLFRRKAIEGETDKPAMSPEEEAMFNLNKLFDSDLLRRGKIKDYYLQLSEILRAYFERRFSILAIEYTTDEIMRALRQKELPRELRDKIEEVLQASDLAKFAKWTPEPAEIIQINQKSKQIVEMSAPKEEAHGVS